MSRAGRAREMVHGRDRDDGSDESANAEEREAVRYPVKGEGGADHRERGCPEQRCDHLDTAKRACPSRAHAESVSACCWLWMTIAKQAAAIPSRTSGWRAAVSPRA
jgi:hypothetical protein